MTRAVASNHIDEVTVGLINWCHTLEDVLDPLGVSFETFLRDFRGSWLFGYIDALRTAGVHTVLFCVSERVSATSRFVHRPTGAKVAVLPALGLYRQMRRLIPNPYGTTVDEAFGETSFLKRPCQSTIKDLTAYLATPFGALCSELRRERCRALICQDYEHPRFDVCVAVGHVLQVPVYASFQGGDTRYTKLEGAVRTAALRRCHGLIIGTQSEIQRVRARYNVPAAKIAQIFNPIDPVSWHHQDRISARGELGIREDATVVAWHGRVLLWRKGLDLLLNAWEELTRNRADKLLQLLLIGTGQDVGELDRIIQTKQLRNVTWVREFVHDRKALGRYLSAADLYVLPSRHEGFPVALIEAMASGLPVVAAGAPGVPDILENGESSGGLVVPVEDAGGLLEALCRLVDNPSMRSVLAENARRRVHSTFSLEAVGQQLRGFLALRNALDPGASIAAAHGQSWS